MAYNSSDSGGIQAACGRVSITKLHRQLEKYWGRGGILSAAEQGGIKANGLVPMAEMVEGYSYYYHESTAEEFLETTHHLKIRMSFYVCIKDYEAVDSAPSQPPILKSQSTSKSTACP